MLFLSLKLYIEKKHTFFHLFDFKATFSALYLRMQKISSRCEFVKQIVYEAGVWGKVR